MELFQFFITAILLLSTTSAKTYSVPHQSIRIVFSITPHLLYTSESNPAFSGYSYTTQDFNGGESSVVFTTGADSMDRLKNEMDSMKMSEEYSQRGKNQENMSSEQQSKSEKGDESNKKQDDSNIKVLNEEKKLSKNSEANNNFIEHQTNSQQVSHMNIPYLAFRENLLNLDLPIFPRYQISSNEIQSQYYTHDPYAHLELPLHNFGFYNPVPLFYQAATIIPDSNSKSATTAVENIKASSEPYITKSSQTNAINSESTSVKSSIESKFNLDSTTNGIEETSSSLPVISMNKLESTTTSEKKITTSETAVTSQSSVEQTTGNEANNTETSPLTEKSSMATM